MIKTISFRALLGLGIATLLSQTVLANNGLTQAETNTMIKEDIASAQVMAEVCPSIIGKNAKFDHNIQHFIQLHLQEYPDKSMTYEKIQTDAEYQTVLHEAHQSAQETSKDEQKSVCDDITNHEVK